MINSKLNQLLINKRQISDVFIVLLNKKNKIEKLLK